MAFRKVFKGAAVVLALVGMGGCTALTSLQSSARPLDTFELSPLPAGPDAARRGRRHLQVALPTATGALASDRIVIKEDANEVQSLPGARWVDDATEHVQLLLVRSLAGTGRFALVTADAAGPPPDLVLLTDIQAFQAQAGADGITVEIRARMTLLRDEDGAVLSARSFGHSATAAGTDAGQVVAAFDEAMTRFLQEVAGWLAGNA